MLLVASERFIHCGVSTCPWLRCSQWVGAGVVSLPDQAVLQGTIAAHGVVIACRRQASGECPWLNVSHWGGADAVPVVTSGGHGPSGTQWICWRITRQPVCASGVDTQRRVIFMEDGRGTLSRSLTVIRRRFPQARGWTSAGGLALRLYSETR